MPTTVELADSFLASSELSLGVMQGFKAALTTSPCVAPPGTPEGTIRVKREATGGRIEQGSG